MPIIKILFALAVTNAVLSAIKIPCWPITSIYWGALAVYWAINKRKEG